MAEEIVLPPTEWKPMKAAPMELEALSDMDFTDWIAEQKLDGARYSLHVRKNGCLLLSPHLSAGDGEAVDKTDRVPHITQHPALKKWYSKYHGSVLDGEIVISSKEGPSKSKLVTSIMGASPEKAIARQKDRGLLVFRTWDILYLHGRDMQGKPQKFRSDLLELVLDALPAGIQIVQMKREYISNFTRLEELYAKELERGGEGLILKCLSKPYVQGKKWASTWIKLKRHATYDAVCTGYKAGVGKYKGTIGALAISQYVKQPIKLGGKMKLEFVGFISGMTDEARAQFAKRLHYRKPLKLKEVVESEKANWFVIEFESQEPEMDTHRYRHGRFSQVRTDKRFDECRFGEK